MLIKFAYRYYKLLEITCSIYYEKKENFHILSVKLYLIFEVRNLQIFAYT